MPYYPAYTYCPYNFVFVVWSVIWRLLAERSETITKPQEGRGFGSVMVCEPFGFRIHSLFCSVGLKLISLGRALDVPFAPRSRVLKIHENKHKIERKWCQLKIK